MSAQNQQVRINLKCIEIDNSGRVIVIDQQLSEKSRKPRNLVLNTCSWRLRLVPGVL